MKAVHAFLVLGAAVTFACGDAPKAPATPNAAPNREASAEAAFVQVTAPGKKALPSGAKLDVPASWWMRAIAGGLVFQEPDRELTVTVLELDADSADAAVKSSLAKLGRTAPTKVQHTDRETDQGGWDESVEIVWETPPSEKSVFAMSVRRKDKKAWATVLEGKLTAFARRGAQVQELALGLEVPGVADEDLSTKSALPIEGDRLAKLVEFLETAREKAHVPGAAVAVVQDGKVVLARGFGTRERGKKEPVTEKTRFMIGSVSKSLSTLFIASLVDSGKLRWNTRVKDLLPTFETGDSAVTDGLTVENTFCACTGMPRRDLELVFDYTSHKPDEVFTAFKGAKPTTPMGETFQYSNQMTALGGFLASRVAEPGKPLGAAYAAAMKARVFGPMGMNDTTASFEEGRRAPVATPHGVSLGGAPDDAMVLPIAIERFVEPVAPAGAIFSTAQDMARYALVELAKGVTPEGKRVFEEASLLERRKPRVRLGPKGGYGLGFATADLRGLQVVTHDGGTFGFVTRLAFVPEKNLGLVVLTNTTSAGAMFVDAATDRLLELAFDAKERAARDLDKAVTQHREQWNKLHDESGTAAPEDVVKRVAGKWKSERLGGFTFVAGKDGLRVDVGEWSSRIGYRKTEDGTERLFFLDPPVASLSMVVEKEALLLSLGQETHRLVK